MKSLRTIRQEPKPAEPVRDAARANRVSGGAVGASNAAGGTRRESRASLPGPSAGWRLPSGQLLVEYALQTCFTGSPFDRPPFLAEKEQEAETQSGVATANETLVTQGIHRLQSAVDRESSEAAVPVLKRPAAARTGKERSRS